MNQGQDAKRPLRVRVWVERSSLEAFLETLEALAKPTTFSWPPEIYEATDPKDGTFQLVEFWAPLDADELDELADDPRTAELTYHVPLGLIDQVVMLQEQGGELGITTLLTELVENPGQAETSTVARRVRSALSRIRWLENALVGTQRIVRRLASEQTPVEGVCRRCGCTDALACQEGCYWANAEHTLCSACSDEESPPSPATPDGVADEVASSMHVNGATGTRAR